MVRWTIVAIMTKSRETHRVGTAEAKARLSELIGAVAYRGDRVLIERRGRPVAGLVGLDDVSRLEQSDEGAGRPRGVLALLGAWADVEDRFVDEFLEAVEASRARDLDRPVDLGA